ncbi:spindle and centriole-associated protein 1 isoform X3 [Cynoglossus semilaevis]|uniref:spindle and centriole-associated protein 1 isoform X3 n=1 Tax=Cynoglossus semilaevis TaxID=244447 RepID=UPI000497337F|nr:spindle and centriole-associated protein 1 isoform X3 [Cynoglossus semilaevis]
MSFLKTGRSQHHNKGKKPLRLKRTTAAKKEWVSTVNDLSVHKLTPAELSHRHEIHKSHNKAAAQWELREKALKSRLKRSGSPPLLDQTSLSIIREVLSDQMLLQDVLARSDRTLAVVKDLFGDAPRRRIGTSHPSVTIAPDCGSDSEPPVVQRPDPPTQLSLLSQSMMDQQALNELQHSEEDLSDEDAHFCGSPEYSVIRRANVRNMKAQSHRRATHQKGHVPGTPRTTGKAPNQAALNATLAVERVRPRRNQAEEAEEESTDLVSHVLNPDLPFHHSERSISQTSSGTSRNRKSVSQISEVNGSSVAFLSGDQSTLGLLQTMLGQVEAELDNLGPDSAPEKAQSPEEHRTQGLTGFSVALINTMARLVQHQRKTEEKIQKQTEERKKWEEELREQQDLIDALTAETMTLREEAATMQVGLQQRISELEQKFDSVVMLIGSLGLLQPDADPCQDCNIKGAVMKPLHSQQQLQHHHQKQQQFVPVHLQSSSSSLTSLPHTSLPSSSSRSQVSEALSSQFSHEAVQAEIAQLSRQNQMIRAQLGQSQSLRSGVSGSTISSTSSGEERRLSSSLSGKTTPESVVERRTSVSSRTGRRNQNLTDKHQVTHQTTSPGTVGVSGVEQRLLELNRQSAAARGRLLELIEQQKHSVSLKTSPSISPIPPSALSPPLTGSPEGLVHMPTKEPQSQTGVDRRYDASLAPSHGFEDETTEDNVRKQVQAQTLTHRYRHTHKCTLHFIP